jgi:hypothetical protein
MPVMQIAMIVRDGDIVVQKNKLCRFVVSVTVSIEGLRFRYCKRAERLSPSFTTLSETKNTFKATQFLMSMASS